CSEFAFKFFEILTNLIVKTWSVFYLHIDRTIHLGGRVGGLATNHCDVIVHAVVPDTPVVGEAHPLTRDFIELRVWVSEGLIVALVLEYDQKHVFYLNLLTTWRTRRWRYRTLGVIRHGCRCGRSLGER